MMDGPSPLPGEEPREIALLSESIRMLAEANTLDEVKDIRDKAEALRLYIKQQGQGVMAQNAAAEIKIRAERRAGEMLEEMQKRSGGDAMRARFHDETEVPPTFSDLGIDKMQAFYWQTVASVPDDVFEQHIDQIRSSGKELTSAGVRRLAHGIGGKAEPKPWTLDEAIEYLGAKAYEISTRWPPEYLDVMGNQLRALGDELLKFRVLRH
jgi:hypothetical protein